MFVEMIHSKYLYARAFHFNNFCPAQQSERFDASSISEIPLNHIDIYICSRAASAMATIIGMFKHNNLFALRNEYITTCGIAVSQMYKSVTPHWITGVFSSFEMNKSKSNIFFWFFS